MCSTFAHFAKLLPQVGGGQAVHWAKRREFPSTVFADGNSAGSYYLLASNHLGFSYLFPQFRWSFLSRRVSEIEAKNASDRLAAAM